MAYPSTSGDLHRFGGHLAAFLAGYEPARTAPYAADVARLEWAVHECAQAAGVPAFDFAALARVAPERHAALRVRVAPAVRWLSSDHPVASIWEANQPGRDGTPAPAQGGEHVLAWRAAATVRVQRIDAAAHRLLDAFATGASVLEAAESLGDAAACLPALLPRWCADGVIASIDLPA